MQEKYTHRIWVPAMSVDKKGNPGTGIIRPGLFVFEACGMNGGCLVAGSGAEILNKSCEITRLFIEKERYTWMMRRRRR
jgi:hypothetical protein